MTEYDGPASANAAPIFLITCFIFFFARAEQNGLTVKADVKMKAAISMVLA